MRQLEKKLKELQKQGVEYVSINDVMHWIFNIRFNQRVKRLLGRSMNDNAQGYD